MCARDDLELMMAKPMKTLELHYLVIQFLITTCSQLSNFPKVDRTVNTSLASSFVLKLMKDILIVRSFLNLIVKW